MYDELTLRYLAWMAWGWPPHQTNQWTADYLNLGISATPAATIARWLSLRSK
jgi:hypothetical protein